MSRAFLKLAVLGLGLSLVSMGAAAQEATVSAVDGASDGATQQGRQTLGRAHMFTNDVIGDGHDRWRTGSYGVSLVRGRDWAGALPHQFGQIMEYRFRGEIIAPASLSNPAAGDRLYAGMYSLGAHTHFTQLGFDLSVGADVVVLGEQTGLRGLQSSIHDMFSMPTMRVTNFQVANQVLLHGTFEAGRDLSLGQNASLRPFVELQAGLENMARVGADLTIGGYGQGGLRLRDSTTGNRISAIDSPSDHGLSFLLGGDFAYVDSSELLPASRGYTVEDNRSRFRAGVNYAFGNNNVFYGLTYLSEEYVGQPEGQVIGSISLGLRF